jgi:hypothetical protein
MNRSRRGVNPAQVSRGSELLRPQRQSEDNLSVPQLRLDSVIAVSLNDPQYRKLTS